jgi:FAD-dependent urate hydroxylase
MGAAVMSEASVVILGAGPNGLAAAAHLRAAGVETRVFGEPMGSWIHDMPRGMRLRSSPRSSNIATPDRSHSLEDYAGATGAHMEAPLPIEGYVDYGIWYQRSLVPDVENRRIARIRGNGDGLVIQTTDGEHVPTRRVVVAAGITRFAWRPPRFDDLPSGLTSHSFDHSDFARFAGREVLVVGSGPSALETAALLAESGASVQLVARQPEIRWVPPEPQQPTRWQLARSRISSPPTDVGPPLFSWLAAAPALLRRAPAALRDDVTRRCLLPTGHQWVRERLKGNVSTTMRATIASAVPEGDGLLLTLEGGERRRIDHLLFATGYRVDVTRYPFLGDDITGRLRLRDGYPVLGPGLESSVPGLHFLGAPAAASFGPITRFVVGSWFTAPAVTACVTGRRERLLALSY